MISECRSGLFIVLGLLLVGLPAGRAQAQAPDCDQESDLETELRVTPPKGVRGVALNTPIIVRYPRDESLDGLLEQLDRDDEPWLALRRVLDDDRERLVTDVEYQRLDSHAIAFQAPLRADTEYRFSVGGFPREFDFITGDDRDEEPPEFLINRDTLGLSTSPVSAECGLPEGTLRATLEYPAAHDDNIEGAIEYLIFLTRSVEGQGPVLKRRLFNPGGTVVPSFLLTPTEASEPVCVAIVVLDALGKRAPVEPEFCFDPVQGNYFDPMCAVSAPGRGGPGLPSGVGFLVPFLGLLVLRRRRARRQRRAST